MRVHTSLRSAVSASAIRMLVQLDPHAGSTRSAVRIRIVNKNALYFLVRNPHPHDETRSADRIRNIVHT